MATGGVAVRALAAALAAAVFGLPAQAQPSTKIGTAPLVSPAAADAYYGGATLHTNSTGESGRPKEVVELARALKGDPDLIYEHIRNNMAPVWTYGLSKGALGVIVDRAGTAFDQTHLMVELLRESGWSADYKLGTITLSGAQFQAWTGTTSATAACQLLSSGGIPAIVNGSTTADCSYGAASVTTVELAHAWVAVNISGVTYVFDPAYKDHTFKGGLDLATSTGLASGAALSVTATSGVQSGVPYAVGYDQATLATTLGAATSALETAIANNAPGAGLSDVVGGKSINRQAIPAGGLRQLALPYTANVLRTISGDLPDAHRSKLRVQLTKVRPDTSTPTIVDKTLYVDEIYGRRLTFEPNFDTSGASFTGALKLTDEFGAALTLASASYPDNPTYSRGTATFTVDLPYAANAGAYMDGTIVRAVAYALPFTVVHGWGDTGRGLIDKWGQRRDSLMPTPPDGNCAYCFTTYRAAKGDGRREVLAAAWLAQASRAGQLHAAIGKGLVAHHYSVGVSAADAAVVQAPAGWYWVNDSFDRLDVQTGLSFTSTTANAADRRAVLLATAASLSALKGSVSAQLSDLPDVTSAATRFQWGNAPPTGSDPPGAGSRRVYAYADATQAGQALSLTKTEAVTTTTETGVHEGGQVLTLGPTEVAARRQAVADAVAAYVAAGFVVTAGEEAYLGPGTRGGSYTPAAGAPGYYTHQPTLQRGGAIAATKYDANGDPLEVAHVVVGPGAVHDGGGGGAQTFHQTQYDPATSADVVKGRFVTPPVGSTSIDSPAKLAIGAGEFPFRLVGGWTWRDDEVRNASYSPRTHREPQGGWTTPFDNNLTISGSGLEAMGETDVRAGTATIAAFYAAQDVYRAAYGAKRELAGQLVAAWWAGKLAQNVATVSVGTSTRQFVRKGSGAWFAPGTAMGTLTQTGAPTVQPRHPDTVFDCQNRRLTYVPTRGWSYAGVSFAVGDNHGGQQTFVHWSNQILEAAGGACAEERGFRMSTWGWATGAQLSFTYARSGNAQAERLTNVANNLLQYSQITLTDGGRSGFQSVDARQLTASQAGSQWTHTPPGGEATKFDVLTLGSGDFAKQRVQRKIAPDDPSLAAVEYAYDSLGRVRMTSDRLALRGGRAPTQLFLADGLRAETLDASGGRSVVYADREGRPFRTINAIGAVTETTYDGRGRVVATLGPEGQQAQVEYNDRNLPTKTMRLARTGSAEAGQTLVEETGWHTGYDLPAWRKDARGAQTDFQESAGRIVQVTQPPAEPGQSHRFATYSYTYAAGQPMGWSRSTGHSVTTTYYGAAFDDLTETVNSTSGVWEAEGYSSAGDPTQLKNPGGGRRNFTYDALRRPTMIIEPQVGSSPRTARRLTYDPVGRVTKVEQGTYAGTTFTPLLTYTAAYDAVGNRVKEAGPASVIQTSYDALDRPVCRAVRMNPLVFDSLPADACQPSPPGANGPDRITRTTYDGAGRVVQLEAGVGSDLQQVTQRQTYNLTGLPTTLTDANGNTSTFEYDGFDRLKRIRYPAAPRGSGVSSTTDYEEFGYDANGNRTSWRKRSSLVNTYQYDQLNRLKVKDLAGGTAHDVYYEYSDTNTRVHARIGSPTSSMVWTQIQDGAGRTKTDVSGGISYDNEGRITAKSIHGVAASYAYDLAGRLSSIAYDHRPYGGGGGTIMSWSYDALGRPQTVTRPNGVTTRYEYEPAGRLSALSHGKEGQSTPFVQSYGYNPSGQLVRQTQASDAYVWSGQPTTTVNYTHDQLNRDAALAAAAGYDADGNLISDGVRTFSYDAENRLRTVVLGSTTVTLDYDPWGRLLSVSSGGATTAFAWIGSQLWAEGPPSGSGHCCDTYNWRKYIHAGGVDRPLFSDDVAWNAPAHNLTFFHQDRLGSVVGTSSSAGVITPYVYGPYGEPQSWAGSRFRYTGQIAVPEAQLYHYKARLYDPMMGRFLQTDPVGYGDGPNIYAYVGGDPVNSSDPTGLAARSTGNDRPKCEGYCLGTGYGGSAANGTEVAAVNVSPGQQFGVSGAAQMNMQADLRQAQLPGAAAGGERGDEDVQLHCTDPNNCESDPIDVSPAPEAERQLAQNYLTQSPCQDAWLQCRINREASGVANDNADGAYTTCGQARTACEVLQRAVESDPLGLTVGRIVFPDGSVVGFPWRRPPYVDRAPPSRPTSPRPWWPR